MNLTAFQPSIHYDMLFQALHAEGLNPGEMSFATDHTCIVGDERGPIGFFSFSIEDGSLVLKHYMVFHNRRSLANAVYLFRYFTAAAVMLGHCYVICSVDTGKKYLARFLKYWGGRGTAPYAVNENGTEFYRVPVTRGGIK
jgi:hypothetical protein